MRHEYKTPVGSQPVDMLRGVLSLCHLPVGHHTDVVVVDRQLGLRVGHNPPRRPDPCCGRCDSTYDVLHQQEHPAHLHGPRSHHAHPLCPHPDPLGPHARDPVRVGHQLL